MGHILLALVSKLVPSTWRASIVRDLEEEATARGHGLLWLTAKILSTGTVVRLAVTGDALAADSRIAVRSLLRAKAFTAGAVLTLVLGIAVNLAVFAVVDRVLFRPLPFKDPSRLVMVSPYDRARQTRYESFNKPYFLEGRALPGVEAIGYAGFTSSYRHTNEDPTARGFGLTDVSYNLPTVLGVRAVIGRVFTQEDTAAGPRAAMITYESWVHRLGHSGDVLGQTLTRGKDTVQIVGVLPPEFQPPAMNRPLQSFDGVVVARDTMMTALPNEGVDPPVVRLRAGVSIGILQQQFDTLSARLGGHAPTVLIEPLREAMYWYGERYLWMLAAAAALVGLLACANLSSLLLARGRSRAHDVALRLSLGGTRGRIVAGELMQSLVIAGVASGLALVAAYWTLAGLASVVPNYYRMLLVTDVDARVAGFVGCATVVATLVAGVVPAWRASRTRLMGVMQEAAAAAGQGRHGRVAKSILVFEAAASVVLVLGATMAVRGFAGLANTDSGVDLDRLYSVAVSRLTPGTPAADVAARDQQALETIRHLPGVASAAGVDIMFGASAAPMAGITLPSGRSIGRWQVTDQFMQTVGGRLLAGRDFTAADVASGANEAILTERAVQALWPGIAPSAALGRTIGPDARNPPRQVIGVVADIRETPDQPAAPMVFAVAPAPSPRAFEIVLRAEGRASDAELGRAIMDRLGGTVRPAGSRRADALEQPRMQAVLFGSLGIISLLLAGLGLFAVTSFDVAMRQYELGVRAALGASARAIERLVILDALRPVAFGAAAGLVLSYWAAKWMETLVYRVRATDPVSYAVVAVVLGVATAIAAWLPARRAAHIDPATTLRAQ